MTPAARLGGSRFVCPATSAAAKPSMKLRRSSHRLNTYRLRGNRSASFRAATQKRAAVTGSPRCQPIALSASYPCRTGEQGVARLIASGHPGGFARGSRQQPVTGEPHDHLPRRSVRMMAIAHASIDVLDDEKCHYEKIAERVGEERPRGERPGHRERSGNDRHDHEEDGPGRGEIARIAREIGCQLASAT